MAFFFVSNKKKDPNSLAKSTKDGLQAIEKISKGYEKISEETSKNVSQMKAMLCGDPFGGEPAEPNSEVANQLAQEVFTQDILPLLISQSSKLEFEAKKDVVAIVSNLLKRGKQCVDYLCKNAGVLNSLILGYENEEMALYSGQMLRECTRHDSLVKLLLLSPSFFKFFEFVESTNFHVAVDAFSTLKELLTKHKNICAEFLEKNYNEFFEHYTKLLSSENHVTKRQSLKILGEILLDRANFHVMTKYISDVDNLKLIMNLLRDKSKNIQFEAFHVFKIFVANPNKTDPVLKILTKNKARLVGFLTNFQQDNEEDQFNDEKNYLINQIRAIPDPVK